MDVDTTAELMLQDMRSLAQRISHAYEGVDGGNGIDQDDAVNLAEAFKALDEYLTDATRGRQPILPKDWQCTAVLVLPVQRVALGPFKNVVQATNYNNMRLPDSGRGWVAELKKA